MATVVAVYTGQGLTDTIMSLFQQTLPEHRLVNIIDDSIIHDVIRAMAVTAGVARRLVQYYQIAEDMGAQAILNTCSSVGEVVELGQKVCDVPIIRIDEPMAKEAVSKFRTLAVLATVPSTLDPTVRLLRSQAKLVGRSVEIVEGLAEGAYQSLVSGDPETHDRLISETAHRVAAKVEALVLAQGSMTRMEKFLSESIGKEVLSSPMRALCKVKAVISQER